MYEYRATVVRVVDGDTVYVTADLGFDISFVIDLRLLDFDAPEIFHYSCQAELDHGERAKALANRLLPVGETVTINTQKDHTGKYGRYLARITLPDGRDFVTVMRQHGMQKRASYS